MPPRRRAPVDPVARGWPDRPIPCVDLVDLVEVPFDLPCGDPWLLDGGTAGHAYLEAAARGWDEHPEWMDYLDLASPINDLKRAERDLYLHWWRQWLGARRVLDVGCGIGRLTMPFLDRGATVIGMDGDLESLRRCAWHAAGRPGSLALHWTSTLALPQVEPVDVAIACEVLCYVPDIEQALAAIVARLRPGGTLLLAMEAPFGWATAEDAPEDSLDEALRGAGVIDKPGDRWVRTFDADELRALLTGAGLRVDLLEATHYVPDGPLERCLDPQLSLERLLEVEEACRRHRVWAPLHRIWTCAATLPA
jgi:S-adenosylmethionine-dependent methyltransferase